MKEYSTVGFLEQLAKVGAVGTIVSLPRDGRGTRILGIVGAVDAGRDACEVFILATKEREDFPVIFAKTVKQALNTIRGRFKRVQALGEDTAFFTRWFLWLGFSCEGPAEPGPHGEKMSMWAMQGHTQ